MNKMLVLDLGFNIFLGHRCGSQTTSRAVPSSEGNQVSSSRDQGFFGHL